MSSCHSAVHTVLIVWIVFGCIGFHSILFDYVLAFIVSCNTMSVIFVGVFFRSQIWTTHKLQQQIYRRNSIHSRQFILLMAEKYNISKMRVHRSKQQILHNEWIKRHGKCFFYRNEYLYSTLNLYASQKCARALSSISISNTIRPWSVFGHFHWFNHMKYAWLIRDS